MPEVQELIETAREKVRGYLSEIDPEYQDYDSGMFTIEAGSAVIGITLRPWHEGDVAIEFTSQLVNSAELNLETMKWLLETNADLHFGGFGLLFDGTIIYSYSVPSATVTQETFSAITQTIAAIADHYDDAIMELAGGVKGPSVPEVEID